ncbi:MAG: Gfo/Idh/MocA family oxidoreductase [Proteobacteria bacterium]|nr:Gfo/Idh/MocA family oxidoreductase [Pseudomonadota bacterium]
MAGKPLGIGLIGCGDIAPTHTKALEAAESVKLVACTDVAESSAKRLGEECGVPWTTNVDEMLERAEVEAVTIATPAFTHLDLVSRAAKAGKAIVCEKPLAASMEDAAGIVAAAKEAGVPLSTCFPLRYTGAADLTKELIESGALGEVIEVRLRNLGDKKESYWTGGFSGRTVTDWRKSKQASGGGVIITNLIHHLDLARAITGLEVTRVYSELGTFATEVEVEDLGAACLRYENDAVGVVEGSSCFPGSSKEADVVVAGTKGQCRFGLWSGNCEVYLREAAAGIPAQEWVTRDFEDPMHIGFYNAFAAAVRAGDTPPVTGEDGRKALEMVVAIYRSAELGQPVSLPL